MAPPSREAEELELAAAVRTLQKRGLRDAKGRNWHEWLEANEDLSDRLRRLFDPNVHTAQTLRAFIAAVAPPGELDIVERRLKRSRRTDRAFSELRESYVAADASTASSAAKLFALIGHTRAHPRYRVNYGGLGGKKEDGWVATPRRARGDMSPTHSLFPPKVEDLLLAIDCEMVATADDPDALARVCVCNGQGRVLLDRLVKPKDPVTDLRTHITDIKAEDLEAVEYRLADAQADILKLMTPNTVLVGHTLNKDLSSLHIDAPLIIDIAFLYGYTGLAKSMPSLTHLVEQVLSRPGFRGEDGQAPHNCMDDVCATMELLLHRLRTAPARGEIPRIHWVPPPARMAAAKAAATEAAPGKAEEMGHTLLAHRIPDRPGMFPALVALFANLGGGAVAKGFRSVNFQPQSSATAAQKFRSAGIIFESPEAAQAAFEALPAIEIMKDRGGRPQKQVLLPFGVRDVARIYVRSALKGTAAAGCTANALNGVAPAKRKMSNADAEGGAARGGACGEASAAAEEGRAEKRPRRPPLAAVAAAAAAAPWPGWRAAAEEELRGAPDRRLPWQQLRSLLVARRRRAAAAAEGGREGAGEDDETLGCRALSSLPESFLSREDAFVRLPRGTDR